MADIEVKKRSERYRGRITQIPIYIGKCFRMFELYSLLFLVFIIPYSHPLQRQNREIQKSKTPQ